jgi:DNA-directed RNA polymerase specialized sigma24 family protein
MNAEDSVVVVLRLRRERLLADPCDFAATRSDADQAWASFWQQHCAPVARDVIGQWQSSLKRLGLDPGDVETQLKAHLSNRLDMFSDSDPLEPWLRAVFTNKLRDLWNAARNKTGLGDNRPDGDEVEDVPAPENDDAEIALKEIAHMYNRFASDYLKAYPGQPATKERDIRIFYLRHVFPFLEPGELARAFGLRPPVIAQALNRVRNAFAEWLRAKDPDGFGQYLRPRDERR